MKGEYSTYNAHIGSRNTVSTYSTCMPMYVDAYMHNYHIYINMWYWCGRDLSRAVPPHPVRTFSAYIVCCCLAHPFPSLLASREAVTDSAMSRKSQRLRNNLCHSSIQRTQAKECTNHVLLTSCTRRLANQCTQGNGYAVTF